MAHDVATVVFVVGLPLAVPWGMLVFVVLHLWSLDMRAVLGRLRDQHVEDWVREGRPWWTLYGPGPARSPQERPVRRAQTQPWPSWAWMWRFSFGPLPPAWTGDPELVRLHRHANIVAWISSVCCTLSVPYVALAFWVLYF